MCLAIFRALIIRFCIYIMKYTTQNKMLMENRNIWIIMCLIEHILKFLYICQISVYKILIYEDRKLDIYFRCRVFGIITKPNNVVLYILNQKPSLRPSSHRPAWKLNLFKTTSCSFVMVQSILHRRCIFGFSVEDTD